MLAYEQSMYELGGVWRRHIEWVWSIEVRTVPDDWSPDLQDRANRAAARGEERDYCDWVHAAYGEDPPGW